MMDAEKLRIADIVRGYFRDTQQGAYVCAECGRAFAEDEVFALHGRFYTAARAVTLHLGDAHPDRLQALLAREEKYLSMTENQKQLLSLFAAGLTDAEVARRLGLSCSTVRHQRFTFREKAKAAKMYLAVWELAALQSAEKRAVSEELLTPHKGARMVDERYVITEDENEKILKNVFSSLEPLRLQVFSSKEKKKLVILRRIAEEFEAGKTYTEQEVCGILRDIYDDFATLRRYLIEYGFMERTADCASYWRK